MAEFKIRTTKWKWLVGSAIVLGLGGIGVGLKVLLMPDQKVQTVTQPAAVTAQKEATAETVINLAMLGDMLAHDSVNAQAKTANGYDYTSYFKTVRALYKDADVVFCNPETPVAGDSLGVSGYPTFNAPSAFAKGLVDGAGCTVINLASNHMSDKGQAGIDQSRAIWKELQPFAYHGSNSSSAEQQAVAYFKVKNVSFAFVAFADFSNATPPNTYSLNTYHDSAFVQTVLAEARKNASVVLVSAHWGTEDSNDVNADQKAAAQLFADNGATLVIGTGPHVDQAVSWLKSSDGRDVPVWYSIGNMLSSQLDINELTSGVAQCRIRINETAVTVDSLSFAPTFMSYDWSAADKAAGNLLARSNLTLQPLAGANTQIQSMFGSSYSVEERRAYLERVLDASAARVTIR